MKLSIVAFAVAALAAAAPAVAQVSLENKVLREDVRVAANGARTVTLVPARTIAPGSNAVYVMTYRNGGRQPASNLVISNPVPTGVTYAGVGPNSPEPMVSVDRGRTFGQLRTMTVRAANGAQRAAQFSDVTNVRWTVSGPVAPGASGSVSYKGTLQ